MLIGVATERLSVVAVSYEWEWQGEKLSCAELSKGLTRRL